MLPKFLKFGGGYLLYLFFLYLFWAIKTVRTKPNPKIGNKSYAEMQASITKERTLMEKIENRGIWVFGDTIPRRIKLWVKDWWVLLVLVVGVITGVKYIFDIISFFSNKR
jgi:Ca2+/Na+ antiporter